MCLVVCTAKALGVSPKLVSEVTTKIKKGEQFVEAEKRNKCMQPGTKCIVLVHNTIFNMYKEKENVTLDSLLAKLFETRNFCWRWSRTTLWRLLTNEMDYSYGEKSPTTTNHMKMWTLQARELIISNN